MATITTPYDSAVALVNTKDIPTWVNSYDAKRLATYGLYESIYWTAPQTFKIAQRGANDAPIYVPSGRVICNTMDRYTGVNWAPIIDPTFGTPEEQAQAQVAMTALLRRENFFSHYQSNKLYGIIKGDWCWYLTGNAAKAPGTRLSLKPIDPAMVFPLEDPDDVDRVLGYDLAEEIVIGTDTRIKRTRYLKSEHPEYSIGEAGVPGGPIEYSVSAFEITGWEDPDNQKEVRYDYAIPPVALDPRITALPVFHIKNFEEPGNGFGSSEMRGLERLMAAINQGISDEELTLALQGLGVYRSSKAAPASGNWGLGPGRVVHDEHFERVNGVTTIQPMQDHLKYLHDQMDQVTGISDVAKGMADVSVAESGIALSLRLSPILTASGRKDVVIRGVMDQLLWNLRDWFLVYEGINMEKVVFVSSFGEKMPQNNKERFEQLLAMYTASPPLITAAYFRDACREMGIDIPVEVNGAAIAAEQAAMQAAMDPYGERLEDEETDTESAIPEDEQTVEV